MQTALNRFGSSFDSDFERVIVGYANVAERIRRIREENARVREAMEERSEEEK